MAEVRFEHVEKIYPGRVHAVRDFSLDVTDGEFVVLVGPSGCGKSTILRVVAGLESITSGTVAIGGRVVNDVSPRDRNIAMVFQSYALYPHMTVERNMSFGLRMRRVPKPEIEQRVARAAALLGIDDLLGRKPAALSGGQQQRVALGRAIVREPACFLFDEPLSNLDARLRTQMRAEIKALHQRLGTTMLYVTHDQEEAMTLGDRVVVMGEGRVQQIGTPLEVYRRPANSFVAGFVGSPSMNLLDGRVRRRDGGLVFDGGNELLVALGRDGAITDDTPAVLGVRPEALDPTAADGAARLELDVSLCEPIGDRMDVHATTRGGTTLVARIPAREMLRPGETITLGIEPGGVHLFEPGPYGARMELEGRD